jgi:hypothetical protein
MILWKSTKQIFLQLKFSNLRFVSIEKPHTDVLEQIGLGQQV